MQTSIRHGRKELVKAIVEVSGMTTAQASMALRATLAAFESELAKGFSVSASPIGLFFYKYRKGRVLPARKSRGFEIGATVQNGSWCVKFRPSPTLRQKIKEGTKGWGAPSEKKGQQ